MGVEEQVERLCEELVLADLAEDDALADVRERLLAIADAAGDDPRTGIARAAAAAAALVLREIREPALERATTAGILGRTAGALQQLVREGASADEVALPPELSMETVDEVPEPAAPEGREAVAPEPEVASAKPDLRALSDFATRARVHLDTLDSLLIALQGRADDAAILEGISGVFEALGKDATEASLDEVQELAQESGSCLALARAGGAALSDPTLNLLFGVSDAIRELVWSLQDAADTGSGETPEGSLRQLTARVREIAPVAIAIAEDADAATRDPATNDAAPLAPPETATAREEPTPAEAPVPATPGPSGAAEPVGDPSMIADFVTEAEEHLDALENHLIALEANPRDGEALNATFRAFHTIKGGAGYLSLDTIQQVTHEAENLLQRARRGELEVGAETADLLLEASDVVRRCVGDLVAFVETGAALPAREQVSDLVDRLGAVLRGEQPRARAPETAVAEPAGEEIAPSAKVKEIVRVDAERLDQLVDTIGEIVIAGSMVSHSPDLDERTAQDLRQKVDSFDSITRELQQLGTSLRMVTVRGTFQKMARVARDTARRLGKPIEFTTAGEDTELDKHLVDMLGDPLVHVLRNAVDHGIEPAEERARASKPGAGNIELRAFHRGGNVHIEIEDDGCGLDREAIVAKAVDRGLLRTGDAPSDREVFNLIMEPGFSTAGRVTETSGRGVGMDVVKRHVEALRGRIEIHSRAGKGTKFSLTLPLTLAIIEGMALTVGDECYVIPTLSIITTIRPGADEVQRVFGKGEMLLFQEELVPVFRLSELLDVEGAERDPARGLVVIVEADGRRVGLLVDQLTGQQQVVIKPLGEDLQGIPGIAGGMILPDGQVGVILDVSGLAKLASASRRADAAEQT